MKRRDFIKLAGALSGSAMVSCDALTHTPEKLIPYLVPPDEGVIPGEPTWLRSTCSECPAGCGLLVKVMEGRPVKLEGNPDHPLNAGALCIRGQAGLERLYRPERLKRPLLRNDAGNLDMTPWRNAFDRVKHALADARGAGLTNVFLSGHASGALDTLRGEFCGALGITRAPTWEVYHHGAIRKANRLVFGRATIPDYRLDNADVVVTLGADLLGTFINPVAFGRRFATARDKGLSWFHLEPHVSLTGLRANTRLVIRSGSEPVLLAYLLGQLRGRELPAAIAKAVAKPTQDEAAQQTGLSTAQIDALVAALNAAKAPLILAGDAATATPEQGLSTACLTALIQWRQRQDEGVLDFANDEPVEHWGDANDAQRLAEALKSGRIGVLFLARVAGLAAVPELAANLGKAKTLVVLDDMPSPAVDQADVVFATSHALESWGDAAPRKRLRSLIQPALKPLHDTKSEGDVLLALIGKRDQSYQQYCITQWGGLDEAWLETGVKTTQAAAAPAPLPEPAAALAKAVRATTTPTELDQVLIVTPSVRTFDGRSGPLSLLHEIPDPLNAVSYGEVIGISEGEAKTEGIQDGDVVEVRSTAGKVRLPARVQPGLPNTVRVMSIVSALPLNRPIDKRSGELTTAIGNVVLHRTGERRAIPVLSGEIDGASDRAILPQTGEPTHHRRHAPHIPRSADGKPQTLYPEHKHKDYTWSMVVDLDKCTGCSACVAACYLENNVPLVGEEEHLKGREMAWLRIQPYRHPERELTYLPMMCQHCEHAPCEPVCPVFATYHNPEGLNAQIYNRCVGTRYCSNNCPYKARRFNWFEHPKPKPLNLLTNPNVSERPKGVMEKCTFCIQRIRAAKDTAKDQDRQVRDGEMVPACMQTCPTQAIRFGNLMDPQSEVAKLAQSPRSHRVLEPLGTESSVYYLSDDQRKVGKKDEGGHHG